MENNLHPSRKYAKSDLEAQESASHGLSKGQLQGVYDAQRAGQEFEKIPANMKNEHLINEHEKFVYHVEVTIPRFDSVKVKTCLQPESTNFHPQCSSNAKSPARGTVEKSSFYMIRPWSNSKTIKEIFQKNLKPKSYEHRDN